MGLGKVNKFGIFAQLKGRLSLYQSSAETYLCTIKITQMSNMKLINAYKKIEDGVVKGYKTVEDAVVGTYQKIEDKFVEKFLEVEEEIIEIPEEGDE